MEESLSTAVIQISGRKILAVPGLDTHRESREVNLFIKVFISCDNFKPVTMPPSEEDRLYKQRKQRPDLGRSLSSKPNSAFGGVGAIMAKTIDLRGETEGGVWLALMGRDV